MSEVPVYSSDSFLPVIQGIDYSLQRIDCFVGGNSEYLEVFWFDMKPIMETVRQNLMSGDITSARQNVELLQRLRSNPAITEEYKEVLESFNLLAQGINAYHVNKEKAYLFFSDFWLKQQHFWHTRTFRYAERYGNMFERNNWKKASFFGFRHLSWFHLLILCFAFIAAPYIYINRGDIPYGWYFWAVYPVFIFYVLGAYVRFSARDVYEIAGLGRFIATSLIPFILLGWFYYFSDNENILTIFFTLITPLLLVFLFIPALSFVNYFRVRHTVENMALFSCLWIRYCGEKSYELVVENEGKLVEHLKFSSLKTMSDSIDRYCGSQVSLMCVPGRGASGALSQETEGVWYKFYPHFASVREVNKRTLKLARWWECLIPFHTRAWSPFVFTDDALLSTPGLTEESLREYFVSNPSCCEPPGYEEYVASHGFEAQ